MAKTVFYCLFFTCRCILYNYTDIQQFPTVFGENGFVIDVDGNEVPTNVFTDKIILNELGLNALGQLDKDQVRFILLNHLGYGFEWGLNA